MRSRTSTAVRAAGALTITALALSACGGASASDDGDVTLRFAWWGSDNRHEYTQEIIDLYEEQNPGVTIETQYSDGAGYFDKLSTQVAGGNAPDVLQMEDQFLREYADRGAFTDVGDVDVSEHTEASAALGETEDGVYGVPLGVVSYGFLANPALFEEAGVEMPDDTSWTWDDYAEVSAELASALGEDRYGATGLGASEASLRYWMRQQGMVMFEDGELQLTEQDAADYLQFAMDIEERGDLPDADWMAEEESTGLEDSAMGSNRSALGAAWATQVVSLSRASGDPLELMRIPSPTGETADNGEWIKAAMFLSVSEDSEHPEEAKDFVDFFVNSPEVGEIMGLERGLPGNLEVREAALEDAGRAEQEAADYLAAIEEQATDVIDVPPAGASQMPDIITRHESEVRFGRMSVDEAASSMVSELEGVLEG